MTSGKINSPEYWENRFESNDWEKYDGGGQSAYFAALAIKAFPDWFCRELNRNPWNIADWGCAEGDGTAMMAKMFPMCHFTGIDFANVAIEKARKKYQGCDFETGDITAEIKKTDVIFSSNLLEHLKNPSEVMCRMVAASVKHTVFLLPLHDESEEVEHFNRFDEDFFPLEITGHILSYFRMIDCQENPFWPGEQLLLIYSVKEALPEQRRLSEIFSNVEYEELKKNKEIMLAKLQQELEQQLNEKSIQVMTLQEQLAKKKQWEITVGQQLTEKNDRATVLQKQLMEQSKRSKILQENLGTQEKELLQLNDEKQNLQKKLTENKKRLDAVNYKTEETLNLLHAMLGSRLFKLIHFLYRFRHQGLSQNAEERKKFRKWFVTRFSHVPDNDHRYNPLFAVINQLGQLKEYCYLENCMPVEVYQKVEKKPEAGGEQRLQLLNQPYTKPDIIILAIIDYDFRHQRPQHFAQRLAQSGHRVFYINANFSQVYNKRNVAENLWQVTLRNNRESAIYSDDWTGHISQMQEQLDYFLKENAVRDAIVIVDYPNWVYGALYLRKKYGIRIVTDYMDDFTGFLNPAADVVKSNCLKLLAESDGVMASSQFLYDIAAKYSNHVTMNRNGTEYEYFHRALELNVPKKDKKIIGYYGAIAEWFNAQIVCRCAERFPECDIILVGNVTAHREKLERYSNIRLIGEVPYTELLPWLASFDVCLIPFDASTDLIKATNPVKFYEYLSAGKKIVATEIPELQPYKNQFAYLENDPENFCEAVKLCLDGTDRLAGKEECYAFAKENDWDARAEIFEREAMAVYPKISIIVLCYNQLNYTKQCVESVLHTTAYPNYELILVDNASSDGTADYLQSVKQRSGQIKVVLNQTNRGFAGGNNDGIAVADGEYLVLLNNDTVVTRGWLTNMLKHFQNDSAVGLVGPVTNSIGNEARICVPYMNDMDQMSVFADRYTFEHMGEEYPHHGILAMFCLMISRELYDKVGPLDEHYGIGMFEDDDYSIASEKNGYRNVIAEDVFIHHYGSVSFKKLEDETYRKLFEQNKAYYEKKWKEPWKKPFYRPGVS